MNLTFAVATNAKYLHQTLPILFDSMKRNGITGNQIKVFVNEAETDSVVEESSGITYYMCSETTYFEWIIPKLILAHNLKSDWWFFLHDTVILGDTFLEKVMSCNNRNDVNIIMNSRLSNNMGMISQGIFERHHYYFKNSLELIRHCTHTANFCGDPTHPLLSGCGDDVFQRKLWIVKHENEYLKLEDYKYFHDEVEYTNLQPREYCGSIRHVEYFPGTDLYKMKKNIGTSDLRWTL